MVALLAEQPSARLLKHVVRCYHRLADNSKARDAMRTSLPAPFRDGFLSISFSSSFLIFSLKRSFSRALKNDQTTKKCLQQLLAALSLSDLTV